MLCTKWLRAAVTFSLLFISLFALAQDKVITGKVLDTRDGSPVAGANVSVKGTARITQTGSDGTFSITISGSATTLIISSVGFTTQEVDIAGKSTVDISLVSGSTDLGDVVVVGYGTQRKKEVTGAISKVTSEQLNAIPVPSFEAALQGKAPGVQVLQGNGLAGSGAVIRIRGVGSISAGGDPLYVIDGIPIVSDPFLRGDNGGMNQNPLASINPADIESIEILKDAGAAGIYGSRGANGVILITTKRGKTGKASFNYSNKLGFTSAAGKPSFLNNTEWLQINQEAWNNSGRTGQATLPNGLTYAQAESTNTDWWDELTQTGHINEHNLSFNKGTQKFKTFANISYSNNEGYILANSYTRASARLNMDYTPNKKLKIALTSGYNYGLNKRVPAAWDGGLGSAMSTSLPIFPVYREDGFYYTNMPGNSVFRIRESKRREADSRFLGGISIEYQLVKNLFIKANASTEYRIAFDDEFQSGVYWQGVPNVSPEQGRTYRTPYWGNNWNTSLTANYNLNLNDDNKISILLGQESQSITLRGYTGTIFQENTSKPFWDNVNTRQTYRNIRDKMLDENKISKEDKDAYTFTSFFGRVNYNIKDKYFLQLSGRLDGSSKFGSNNKYGFFPAISGAWNVSDESIFDNVAWLSLLKLRASYGIVGNANIPSGEYYDDYRRGGVNYNGNQTLYLNGLGNPDLQWETMRNTDVGLELGLFNNRITGEVAYYRKISTDLLMQSGVSPSATGTGNVWRNLHDSKILNEGIEISANIKVVDGKNFKWAIGGNIAKNYNEVLDMELGPDAIAGGYNDTRVISGLPLGVNYLVRYHGVDPNDGLPIWLDKDGKQTKTFSLDHRVFAGAILPDFIGGFFTNFEYKGLQLQALFSYVIGGNIYESSAKYQFLRRNNSGMWNYRKDMLDRWTGPGDDAQYPKVMFYGADYPGVSNEDQFNSTMFLRDADYLRLRELTLSYKVGNKFLERCKIKGLRLYATGSNLFTFTKFPGGDPEITRDFRDATDRNLSPNISYLTAPTQRSIIFGLNLTF